MKWTKINQRTGEPYNRTNGYSFEPHDYVSGEYRIINHEWCESKFGWILTKNGEEVKRFNKLKEAKEFVEGVER